MPRLGSGNPFVLRSAREAGEGTLSVAKMQTTAAGYQRARDRLSRGGGSKEHENADAAPFQPHFLQQETIFAHGYTCLSRPSEEITCTKRVWLLSERDCGLRVCDPTDSRDRHLLKGAVSSGERSTARQRQQILLATVKVSMSISLRRNDESDADAVTLLPRFLLQKQIFVYCPHQPRSPIRGNADRLCLR